MSNRKYEFGLEKLKRKRIKYKKELID